MAEIVTEVAKCLVAPVGRQCGYVIFSNRYVHQLEHEVQRLDHERQRVQHSINEAQNNLKPIEADVMRWMEDARTIANKAQDLLEYDRRAKKSCFCGWLPNPKVRYSLGRDARRTSEALGALIAYGQFERVYYERPPPGIVGGDTITSSRDSIFQEIMNALDDKKLRVIGIYGPGGVGKTTLLKEVQRKLRIENRSFDLIATTTVSRTPDLKKIQDDIAFALSLDLKNEPSEVRRRDLLFQKLQSDPTKEILIILDDLRGELDLKAVGIPLGDESRGCKLLLTSRSKDVLEQKMLAGRTFPLEGLKDEEAFRLFEKMVGDRLKSDEELKAIAAQVVKKLAGLPLLIISVASTLKFSGVSAWRNALIKIDESNIETIVKLSYDHLKDEDAKHLFLLCGLIGGTIQVETLLGLCVGLGLFEGFNKTIQHSRDRLNAMLDSLRSFSLLQDGGDDKEKENVTIHDLYSEVVVSTPFRGQNSLMMHNNFGPWSKEKLEKCWAICLVNVGRDWLAEPCGFLDLKILMLSQSEDWLKSPAHQYDVKDCCRLDFTYMKELQVLYLRSMHITTLPSSIEILGNLRSLNLDFCDMEDVAILGKLKALQILSLAGSAIYRLPKEIGELINLRSLNLSNCNMLQIIEPGVLKGLSNLEELHMKGSFDRWMGEDETPSKLCNARLTELKSLTKIVSLEISIRDPTILLEADGVPFKNLIRFRINLGNIEGSTFEGFRTMKLKLEECGNIVSRETVQKTLRETQYLHLEGLRESKKNAHELCTQGLGQLKHLDITFLDRMNELRVLCLRSMHITTLPSLIEIIENLRSLYLNNCLVEDVAVLGKLKALQILSFAGSEIYKLPKEIGELTNLRSLNLSNCNMLQIIEPNTLKGLINLEELHMKGSFDRWMGKDEISSELCNVRLIELKSLTKLTSLEISIHDPAILLEDDDLPVENLIRFWINIGNVEGRTFEGLRTMKLKLEECNNILSREWVQKTLHKTQHLHLDGLRESKKNAHELCTRGFGQLKHLDILNSPSIKYIASSSKSLPLTTFPILESLFLENLINLEKICHGLVELECLNKLKAMSVKKCNQLKSLGFLSEIQRFVQLEEIQVYECESMLAIITDDAREVKVHANDIVELPNVRSLKLGKLPNMMNFCTKVEITSDGASIQVVFPSLEELHITDIGYIKMIWGNHVALSFPRHFQYLKTLDVSHCMELSSMFTPTMARNLVELTNLRISNCRMLTEIISDEGCKEGPVVAFKQLKYMNLDELIGLTCFSSGRYTFLFPLLEVVIVTGCPNMKFFSKAPLRAPKLNEVLVSTEMWFWNRKIGYGMQNMSIDMATVDGVEFMHLSRFSGLTEKWHNKFMPIKSSWQLKSLVVDNCPSFLNAIPSRLMLVLDKINALQVQDCELLEEIFDLEGLEVMQSTCMLPQLWCLNLVNLPKLRQLWNKNLQGTLRVNSLSYLTLYNCSNLRHAFTPSLIQCLPTLQWMEIKECSQLERVIAEEGGEGSEVEKVIFPTLNWMELESLSNLTSFSSGKNHTMQCLMLQKLTIARCPKIITSTWQSLMKIDQRSLMKIDQHISSPFPPQVIFPPVKSMVLSHIDNSRKTLVDGGQHLWKAEAFDKLQIEFFEEIGLPTIT